MALAETERAREWSNGELSDNAFDIIWDIIIQKIRMLGAGGLLWRE